MDASFWHVCPECGRRSYSQTRSRIGCGACGVWMEPEEEGPSEAVRALSVRPSGPSRPTTSRAAVTPRERAYTPLWQRAARPPREFTLEAVQELTGIPYSTLTWQCREGLIDARKGRRGDNRSGWLVPESEVERLRWKYGVSAS